MLLQLGDALRQMVNIPNIFMPIIRLGLFFFFFFFLREVLIASLFIFTYWVFALFVFVLCVVSCATCVLDCPFLIFSPVSFLTFIYSDYADRITSTYSFHY
jgi:hypothetical protein